MECSDYFRLRAIFPVDLNRHVYTPSQSKLTAHGSEITYYFMTVPKSAQTIFQSLSQSIIWASILMPVEELNYLEISAMWNPHRTKPCTPQLKPMDSFGTWRKWNLIYIFFFSAEFYRVVWTLNALLTVHSEMLPFSGNNRNIKMFGVPPNTLP